MAAKKKRRDPPPPPPPPPDPVLETEGTVLAPGVRQGHVEQVPGSKGIPGPNGARHG